MPVVLPTPFGFSVDLTIWFDIFSQPTWDVIASVFAIIGWTVAALLFVFMGCGLGLSAKAVHDFNVTKCDTVGKGYTKCHDGSMVPTGAQCPPRDGGGGHGKVTCPDGKTIVPVGTKCPPSATPANFVPPHVAPAIPANFVPPQPATPASFVQPATPAQFAR